MTISLSRAALPRVAGAAVMTAVTLAAGLPGAAQAAPAAPGDRSVTYLVENESDLRMRLTDSYAGEGVWTRSPTRLIKPDQTGRFGAKSAEERGGTGGSVTYTTTDGDVVISWDNPWQEPNDFGCESPPSISCRMDGDEPMMTHPEITVTLS